MNANEIIRNIEAAELKAELPEFQVGDTVKVYGRIVEGNRTRTQVFEGTVMKIQNSSNRRTFTVRKLSNGVGVEKTWPIHSPNVEKVEVEIYELLDYEEDYLPYVKEEFEKIIDEEYRRLGCFEEQAGLLIKNDARRIRLTFANGSTLEARNSEWGSVLLG